MRNKFISLLLLSSFFSTILNGSLHFHSHHEKIGMHIFENKVEYHQEFSNECEECLIKNNKLAVGQTIKIVSNTISTLIKFSFEDHKHYSLPFDLHCRPPPLTIIS